jgi:carotenoid cleavage dioxygenase-like enzyme
MVLGAGFSSSPPPLPMEGSLPPDLQGMLYRVGPGRGGSARGALHAVELRDGQAVSYGWADSDADAGVFWHAGSVLALPESGLPSQYSRLLAPEEFGGGLTVPIASHVHRVAADGSRVLFSVDGGEPTGASDRSEDGIWLRLGEWDAQGGLRRAQSVALERATWQHDIGVTAEHVVFIESPTRRLDGLGGAGAGGVSGDTGDGEGGSGDGADGGSALTFTPAVPFGWVPGAEGWVGVVPRDGDGSSMRWFRVDPCLVTHVLGAWDEGRRAEPEPGAARGRSEEAPDIALFVCRYEVPEAGQPVDLTASVVGPAGLGQTPIGGGLAVLERWRLVGDRLERTQLDDRRVEYPRMDPTLEGQRFRFGYAVELMPVPGAPSASRSTSGLGQVSGSRSGSGLEPGGGASRGSGMERQVESVGLLKFDLERDEVASWSPGEGRRPCEPLFVRSVEGHTDEEGWLLTVVDDPARGASDLYVLDASSFGRRSPEAIIHLPERLPFRSHGEWVQADRYR